MTTTATPALTPVGPSHVIGGVIHTQILEDKTQNDPNQRFWAQINVPGFSKNLQINNNATIDISMPVSLDGFPKPTLHVEVDNFMLLPANSTAANATAISFLLVFRIVEIFKIVVGSIPVTASLT